MSNILNSFEEGTPVKVQTPDGIVDGVISFVHTLNEERQFAVEFNYPSSGFLGIKGTFSKKTGLPFNWRDGKAKGYKIIIS